MKQVHTVFLSKIIEAHCKKVDGYAAYEEGWSDEKVAAVAVETSEPRFSFNKSHVETLRRSVIGNFPKQKTVDSITIEKIAELERRIQNLEEWASQRGPGKSGTKSFKKLD